MKKKILTLFFIITSLSLFSQNNNSKRIIVVGAGISGLITAKELMKAGYDVIILEAQSKAGGRIKTDRSLGVPFDEGASWIHGPKNNPISKLAIEAKVKTFITDDESLVVYDEKGEIIPTNIADKEYQKYLRILNKVEKNGAINSSFEDIYLEHYKNNNDNQIWNYMLSAYLEFDVGGDISELSSKYFYYDEEFSGEDEIITNGYDKIIDYLSQGLKIQYYTSVTEINYKENKVLVTSEYQQYKADAVIVTVPLGVLKNNSIEFIPKLPKEKREAISRLKMGTVNKYLLTWDKSFWDTKIQYFGITTKEKGAFNYFMNCNKFMEGNSLMTFSFGDFSRETEDLSDKEITSKIMNNLYTIYGDEIPQPKAILRTKWNSNEYTYGSYSYASKNSLINDFETLSKSVDKKLYFAGEHTSQDYRGTVHGAYLSGKREALKVMELLK